ncbi:hypothetical protein SFRURICE_020719 [Spodoptera frugiperda]|nr:hypothetical protein SFRURICE_020719 [Spodoptera frugiperda]
MNELLQKHGCSNVFTVPEGLKELMSDITREVLRWQPAKMLDFIANYLAALLITREHGIMAVKILDELCDCHPTVSEHLLQLGLEREDAKELATIIKNEIEASKPVEGKEKVIGQSYFKEILNRNPLDEDDGGRLKVCKTTPEERPGERPLSTTLEFTTETNTKWQAFCMPEKRKKQDSPGGRLPGPRYMSLASREITGPVDIKIKEDDVTQMFEDEKGQKLGLQYDPMKTITHAEDDEFLKVKRAKFKGSFSVLEMSPPMIIKTPEDDDLEVPENITGFSSHTPEPPVSFEIPEELAGKFCFLFFRDIVSSAHTIDDENK